MDKLSSDFSTTYELKISFLPASDQLRTQVKSWLLDHNENQFVDGFVEGIDIAFDYSVPDQGQEFTKLGGESAPIILYKYSLDELEKLKIGIEESFGLGVEIELNSLDSSIWQEGWKESFKPIEVEKFVVYPPWDPQISLGKIGIEIEPGMAFGTGQHDTTKLCLSLISGVEFEHKLAKEVRVLDVGTGSGVLAIACSKIGFGKIVGTDIDVDAVASARENIKRNQANVEVWRGTASVAGGPFDLVIANILGVVLRKIFPELISSLAPAGRLIISGILDEEGAEFMGLGKTNGLDVSSSKSSGGWLALEFERIN